MVPRDGRQPPCYLSCMNTVWGLDLDMSAVRLMRRNGDAWVAQRVEKIDTSDIEDRLKDMVSEIDDDASVALFLPRDQILFTTVDLDGSGDPQTQIEAAMEGRTPYAVGELAIDWDMSDAGKAHVAAIARDTLDEAAAFAEVRGLPIAGYSTLSNGGDFPRAPSFDGPNIAAPGPDDVVPEPADEPEQPPQFSTARVPSRPPAADVAAASMAATARARFTPTAGSADIVQPAKPTPPPPDKSPVVDVEDTDPVVKVKAPLVPLDPGLPVSAPNAPTRVRTDIAAASVSENAASLTPGGVAIPSNKRAPISIAAVFAVAFLLMIGAAVLVWNLLPMRPSTTIEQPTETGSNLATGETEDATDDVLETDTAELTPSTPPPAAVDPTPPPTPEAPTPAEPTPAPEPEVIAPVELAAPATPPQTDIAATTSPEIGDRPVLTLLAPATRLPNIAGLPQAVAPVPPGLGPQTPPVPSTPASFAGILKRAPALNTPPADTDTTDAIYFSAFELPQISTDAIALPSVRGIQADAFTPPRGIELAALPPAPAPVTPVAPVTSNTTENAANAPVDAAPSAPNTPALEQTDAQPVPDAANPDATDNDVASAVERALEDAFTGPAGLIPTALAARLPDTPPSQRPAAFSLQLERQKFGGRTERELAVLRPPARPTSIQATTPSAPASALAVSASRNPRSRPSDFAALVASAQARQQAQRLATGTSVNAPDTSGAVSAALQGDAPQAAAQPQRLSIPSNASVARQATVESAIRLNRVNLVGVYGAPSDRRALVRLPSGRYLKVKVGDRVDGGTVARITDSELFYQKGNRTLSLQIPRG